MTPLRLLAIIEAATITGPAKNLLQFAVLARSGRFAPPVEVSIAAFRRPGDPDQFCRAAQAAGVRMFEVPEKGRFDRSVTPALRELVREVRPHLIQTHAVKSHFLVRCAALHRSAPWIAFHHGYTWPSLRARVYNQFDRWSLRSATCVVTVSLPFKKQLARIGVPADRIHVVHNAVDPDWGAAGRNDEAMAAVRRCLGIDPGTSVAVIAGRLSKEKDHMTLLRAWALMRRRHPGLAAHLLIVGEGPERTHLEAAARQLGIDGITFTGQQPSVEPYYAIASLALLCSLSEGSPNAALEAMAAGVPLVATAVGGVPEIVEDGLSGLLAPARDHEALAAAMASVLADACLGRRLTENALRTVTERHSPDARARRLCGIYGTIAGGAPAP